MQADPAGHTQLSFSHIIHLCCGLVVVVTMTNLHLVVVVTMTNRTASDSAGPISLQSPLTCESTLYNTKY